MSESPDTPVPTLEDPQVRDLGDRYAIFVDGSDEPAGFTLHLPRTEADGRRVQIFPHTEVKEEYGGHGLASRLVREALDATVAAGDGVVALCPYVKSWLERHEGYAEHLVAPTREHVAAARQALQG